ncbi:MAG: HEAT repeat domain-containing protein [Planctomycetota bacterium]|nr:HEAT repeat domain-containing protein [Planctomycetota bacterium]
MIRHDAGEAGWTARRALAAAVLAAAACLPVAPAAAGEGSRAGEAPEYPAEEMHDTTVHRDEAASDVRIAFSKWPDCYSNATAVRDIFRIEGVSDRADQDKALALWKWFRILVSSTGGGYCYETAPDGKEGIVYDPHKIFTVYGHHMCDGLSWAMVPLWRAAGYIAFDECHHGHTVASLRYRDVDGHWRFHDFDPQARYYFWDDRKNIVSTWTMPVTRGRVHRHLLAPQIVHTLRTSLRRGESLVRSWDNGGAVIQPGKRGRDVEITPGEDGRGYYIKTPGKKDGVYAVAGEEIQTFVADLDPDRFRRQLADGSGGIACSKDSAGGPIVHPEKPGAEGCVVYRLPSPFVLVEAACEAELTKGDGGDECELLLSTDGGRSWKRIHTMERTGTEKVEIPLGRAARLRGLSDAYTAYEFRIKAAMRAAANPAGVGLRALKVEARREFNKRTLPNLRPGTNFVRVSAGRLDPDCLLEVAISFSVKGEERSVTRRIGSLLHYFKVGTGPAGELVTGNYDQTFNVGDVQMKDIRLRLIPSGGGAAPDVSLPAAEAEAAFSAPCPHPANMNNRRIVRNPETDPMQTSGFFPQSRRILKDDGGRVKALLAVIAADRGAVGSAAWRAAEEAAWRAAEDMGNYPEAVDALIKMLPESDIDLTVHICKALAQIGSPKAIGPLLEKWKAAPGGAPGTRYIPDALAAIGDRSVVPALAAKLGKVRFDFRFHIAYALGKLGGEEAEKALTDLAERDPFPAVREFAREQLEELRRNRR